MTLCCSQYAGVADHYAMDIRVYILLLYGRSPMSLEKLFLMKFYELSFIQLYISIDRLPHMVLRKVHFP